MNDTGPGGHLYLMTALDCEARPLIRYFGLQPHLRAGAFKCYGNGCLTLVVTGVGRLAMASGCGFIAGLQSDKQGRQAAWLNVGIGGHPSTPTGDCLQAIKVIDRADGWTFYPHSVHPPVARTSVVITTDTPELDFPEDAVYDMEASAFCRTANRFSTTELVQVVKIVSDNSVYGVETITPAGVTRLIEAHCDTIASLVNQLQALAAESDAIYGLPDEYFEISQRVKLSTTQLRQLQRACQRFRALGGESLTDRLSADSFRSARRLLSSIDALLDTP